VTDFVSVSSWPFNENNIGHFTTILLLIYILDYNFTAKIEQDFDSIAVGDREWTDLIKSFYKKFHPQVESVTENATRESGERVLGEDPQTGKVVLVRLGRFGPMAQIGGPDDEEKKFASLRPDQQLHQVTFEEVMDLFKLPKDLGVYEGVEIQVHNGRFGPYTTCYNRFYRWTKSGIWDLIMDTITDAYDGDVQMIDGTSVRVHHSAATLKKATQIVIWDEAEEALLQKSML